MYRHGCESVNVHEDNISVKISVFIPVQKIKRIFPLSFSPKTDQNKTKKTKKPTNKIKATPKQN